MRILLVEDDEVIVQLLTKSLLNQHYALDVGKDGQEGWDLAELFTYDLILLDVLLPKLDGITFCQRLRAKGNQTPVILLTAQDNSTNKVLGLDAGADDYLAKPFDAQELLARIRALLRRGGSTLPPLLEWKNLQLDPSTCEVTCNGKPLHLTPKEYGLLELFLRNSHRIFSCSALIDHLWSFEEPPTDYTVRSHMKGLRQKLKAVGIAEDPIETVYGIGYKLKPADKQKTQKVQVTKDHGQRRGNQQPQFQVTPLSKTYAPDQNNDGNGSNSLKTATTKSPNLRTNLSEQSHDSNIKHQVATGVAQIWERAAPQIEERIMVIEQASTMLSQDQLSQEIRSKAKSEAHKLVGSLGMFGSDAGSRLAQEIETLLAVGTQAEPATKQQISQLVGGLRQELQLLNAEYQSEPSSNHSSVDERPLLLIVNQEQELAEALTKETSSWGIRVRATHTREKAQLDPKRSPTTPDESTARELITDNSPDVVLLDLGDSDTEEDTLALLAELNARHRSVPVIVMTEKDCLLDRVKVVRLGASAFLQKPVSPNQVLETVTQILRRTRATEATVMIVDDDPQILAALQTLLVPWGMQVYTLDNPLRFLEAMVATEPDLVILDVEMPEITGIELCQVARNDPRWSGVPILFLTAHNDTTTRQQVFIAGADDYVSKPIVEPELITRILNRLERSRWLRNLTEIDALTLVANRRKSTQEINQHLQWSDQYQQPFCFAILELDKIKEINHKYGHEVGDRLLSQLGELLRQKFPNQDIVGRWGGTEFVVGMPGISKAEGARRLAEVLASWRQIEFTATNGQSFHVTFKTAVVAYPQDGSNLQTLYQAADAILEQVKVIGTNLTP